jgi:predicted transcriptional regulator
MASTSEYIDVRDAKKIVVKVLKEYGSLGYSRLLMSTALPENVLETTLDLLIKDNAITRNGEDDPQYRLTPKGISSLWPFS